MTNPDWNRDELILAMDLYFSLDYGQMDGRNPKVNTLGRLLTLKNRASGFGRTNNSVSLKLANFKRLDPRFSGKGMKGGNELENTIWNEFYNNVPLLRVTARQLEKHILADSINQSKQHFRSWLLKAGKPDGTPYQERTIQVYVNQVESGILREFGISVDEPEGLYGISDLQRLQEMAVALSGKSDSKRRRDLRSAFQNYLRFNIEKSELSVLPQLPDEGESRTEGGTRVYISQKAERDIRLRNDAIAYHGTTCQACEFNFGFTYGEWGAGFIEVHHLIPLGGSTRKKRETNAAKDMVVLCSNCHRMVHRKKSVVLTLDELKSKIRQAV